MKRSKLMGFILALALVLVCQIAVCMPASAVTVIGANTTMSFNILGGGGSYAPYEVDINPDGEYCMRGETTATLRLNNVTSNYDIDNVYFTVQGCSYAGSGSNSGPLVTVQGSPISQGVWSGAFDFNNYGQYDVFTVYAYADDGSGVVYFWTKSIKNERVRPTISGLYIASDDLRITGANGKAIVNNNITVNAQVTDNTPYSTSNIKQVTMKLYIEGQSQPIQTLNLPLTGTDHNWGTYYGSFNLLGLGAVERNLNVKVTAIDYSGNSTTVTENFVYDRVSASGVVTYNNQTANSVDFYITTNSDAAGVTVPTFYFWSDANGQDDLQAVYGQQVSQNVWKATLYKGAHNNESGLYYIHVYTQDAINNSNIAGATTYVMN